MAKKLILITMLAGVVTASWGVPLRVPESPLSPPLIRAAAPDAFNPGFEYLDGAYPKIGNASGGLVASSGGVVWIQSLHFSTNGVFSVGGTVSSANLHISLRKVFYNDPGNPSADGPVQIQGAFIPNVATEPMTDWAHLDTDMDWENFAERSESDASSFTIDVSAYFPSYIPAGYLNSHPGFAFALRVEDSDEFDDVSRYFTIQSAYLLFDFAPVEGATPTPQSTATPTPTRTNTPDPMHTPTFTFTPTETPTETDTATFTFTPTITPTFTPTFTPSNTPTVTPTWTNTPTFGPTPTRMLAVGAQGGTPGPNNPLANIPRIVDKIQVSNAYIKNIGTVGTGNDTLRLEPGKLSLGTDGDTYITPEEVVVSADSGDVARIRANSLSSTAYVELSMDADDATGAVVFYNGSLFRRLDFDADGIYPNTGSGHPFAFATEAGSGLGGLRFQNPSSGATEGWMVYDPSGNDLVFKNATPVTVGAIDVNTGSIDFEGRAVFGNSSTTIAFTQPAGLAQCAITSGANQCNYNPSSDEWLPIDASARTLTIAAPHQTQGSIIKSFKVYFRLEDSGDGAGLVVRTRHAGPTSFTVVDEYTQAVTTRGTGAPLVQVGSTDYWYYELDGTGDWTDLPYDFGETSGEPETLWLTITLDSDATFDDCAFVGVDWTYQETQY